MCNNQTNKKKNSVWRSVKRPAKCDLHAICKSVVHRGHYLHLTHIIVYMFRCVCVSKVELRFACM